MGGDLSVALLRVVARGSGPAALGLEHTSETGVQCSGALCLRAPTLVPWRRVPQVEEDNEESEAAHQEALAALEVRRAQPERGASMHPVGPGVRGKPWAALYAAHRDIIDLAPLSGTASCGGAARGPAAAWSHLPLPLFCPKGVLVFP